jgi:hypothetical protein
VSITESWENRMALEVRRDRCHDKSDTQSWNAFPSNYRSATLTSEARNNLCQHGLPRQMHFPDKSSIQATLLSCKFMILPNPLLWAGSPFASRRLGEGGHQSDLDELAGQGTTWRFGIYLPELPISRAELDACTQHRCPLSVGAEGQMRHAPWA